jgi:hypothetical protein
MAGKGWINEIARMLAVVVLRVLRVMSWPFQSGFGMLQCRGATGADAISDYNAPIAHSVPSHYRVL